MEERAKIRVEERAEKLRRGRLREEGERVRREEEERWKRERNVIWRRSGGRRPREKKMLRRSYEEDNGQGSKDKRHRRHRQA